MTAGPGAAVMVALLATSAYHVGLILEKRALRQMPAIDARHGVALLRIVASTPAWLSGFAFMLCGFGLQVLALDLAPVSVVQPVLGSGVVVLLVLSRLVLRERLGRAELACVLAMAAAIIVIALSAVGSAGRVGHQASGIWIAAVAVPTFAIAVGLGARSLRPMTHGRHRTPAVGVSFGVAAGLLYGLATLAIKALSATFVHHGTGWALLLAIAGSPYPYMTVGCSAAGLLIFQTGLQRCRVSIVGPVSNITGGVFFIVAGTWLFGERLPADPARLALRLVGIGVAGVVVVVLSRQPGTQEATSATGRRTAPADESKALADGGTALPDGSAAPAVGAA